MQCNICELDKSRLHCTQCTQVNLWNLRTSYLFTATERDVASDRVQEHLETEPTHMVNVARKERLLEDIRKLRDEKVKIMERNAETRLRIEGRKRELNERRRRFEEHRELARRQEKIKGELENETRRLLEKYQSMVRPLAEARSFLCREAAGLYTLRVKHRRSGKVEYLIGGIPIPNLLHDLIGKAHGVPSINTSLASLSHLLMLVAHYLGIKLTYDINLPGKGNPYPSIQGVHHVRHITIRQLYLDKPLSELAVENAAAHTKFVEAISMLAMNIAELCHSQGQEINEVEQACNVGHNMWKLLAARDSTALTNPAFGRASNATTVVNLKTAQGRAATTKPNFGYKMIVEKIRYTLQGETIVADWDIISDQEADTEDMVKLPTSKPDAQDGGETSDVPPSTATSTPRRRLSSFDRWTRVRSRNG